MRFFKKIIKYIFLASVTLVILDIAFVVTMAHWRPEITHADAVIVMGAAINTPALYNRTLKGLRVYEQGKADVIVLSGGRISNTDISEAQYMEKVIKRNQQGKTNYILEQESHNTFENIRNSKDKIPNAKSVVVVSDEFHLARTVLMARRAGFKQVNWTSPDASFYRKDELNRYYIRELAGIIAYIPKFILN